MTHQPGRNGLSPSFPPSPISDKKVLGGGGGQGELVGLRRRHSYSSSTEKRLSPTGPNPISESVAGRGKGGRASWVKAEKARRQMAQ